MIDHLSFGVADLARARRFYDAALAPLGYRYLRGSETTAGYGDDYAAFWIVVAERPVPPDPASGLHVCFRAPSRAAVDAFYRAALAAGGRDNGAPGEREYEPGYYAAFVIDPDGYRIEAYCGGIPDGGNQT
jgi:catechol 2,3-dioxygenase-like lactoylglutathione lyase family enzyme